jgi:putative membrane protein insertion efficiency factor
MTVDTILVGALRFYKRFISPLLPPACRFYPSCSQYAIGAIQTHGALRGSWLGAKRLGRCHPFSKGGYDPGPCTNDAGHSHGTCAR